MLLVVVLQRSSFGIHLKSAGEQSKLLSIICLKSACEATIIISLCVVFFSYSSPTKYGGRFRKMLPSSPKLGEEYIQGWTQVYKMSLIDVVMLNGQVVLKKQYIYRPITCFSYILMLSLDHQNKMANYLINWTLCSDDFIRSYKNIRSQKSR